MKRLIEYTPRLFRRMPLAKRWKEVSVELEIFQLGVLWRLLDSIKRWGTSTLHRGGLK